MTMEHGTFGVGRAVQLALVGVIGVAFIGFIIGTVGSGRRGPQPAPPSRPPVAMDSSETLPAVRYEQMNIRELGPNRDFRTRLTDLVRTPVTAPAPGTIDPAVKLASLERRENNRAYNGAPPVIPHAIDQMSSESCMACHEDALRVGDRSGGRIPHPYLASCTQCHVEDWSRDLAARDVADNSFQGMPAPLEGPRAWIGAPPIIPHSTLMRTDCLSCHGPGGPAGLQTTHPERQSCFQCHAPSAVLDQYAP
jgi:cytochrome c-type protein NapB